MAQSGAPDEPLRNIKSDSSEYTVGPTVGLVHLLILLDGSSDTVDIFTGRYAGWQGWRPMFAEHMGWMTQTFAAHVHLSVALIGHDLSVKLGNCKRRTVVSTTLMNEQDIYTIWYQYQQTITHQQLNYQQRRELLIGMLQNATTSMAECNQMADRMLGMESNLQADQYGHVQTEETTTTTTTTTTAQTQGATAADPEMLKQRYEFANHFIQTSQQKNVPVAQVDEVAENIRSGKADNMVKEHFEKVRMGTIQNMQLPPPQLPQPVPQQAMTPAPQHGYASSSLHQQSMASPAPQHAHLQLPQAMQPPKSVQQQQAVTPAPQYGYASSSSHQQSMASPAPQYAQPQIPGHQRQPSQTVQQTVAPPASHYGYASSSSHQQGVTSPAPQYALPQTPAYQPQPPPPVQQPVTTPAPQYGYASSSSYQQGVASPTPQYAYPQSPAFQPQRASQTAMFGGQQYATTQTTTTTSTSSSSQQAQQGHIAQTPGANSGYGQPMQQQQLPAAGQAPLQLTAAPHDPNTVANFNQQGGAAQQYGYPGSPQPVVAHAGQQFADPQAYGAGAQGYGQAMQSPSYDQYGQHTGPPEVEASSSKIKKKSKKSKK
ncbi:hypothetical protein LTR48_004016 [Friedmanniomyces endolithicus]|uniref:Uncharacterized protein n=1 Tax=Rachicladosporium monterosium TaxID=1507873 RepID=A0ABR0L6J2_9PEZI|nr:hypothetical protein LTR29_008027 [Friedmanniomyces endolithicus]KAK1085993.1 hypothetical protein LTR48_004016 [Friedmanniomyces endolithicus]KAK5144265.1 hypothetical protein LTR32_003774 [Rachicladosporium monterosium]